MNQYESLFREGISKVNIDRAIVNITNIVSRRIGKSITISEYTFDFENSDGAFTGVLCKVGKRQAIRFNWQISGSSADIYSVSFWSTTQSQPNLELVLSGESLVKVVDVVAETLQDGKAKIHYVEGIKKATASSVNYDNVIAFGKSAFETEAAFTDALQNIRGQDLYSKYMFWYNNLEDEDSINLKFLSASLFYNAVVKIREDRGVIYKFAKKIIVKKASKEIMKVNKSSASNFKKQMYKLSLQDKFSMIRMATKSVIQGYSNARIICGKSGVGKTKSVIEELEKSGAEYVIPSGEIKNARARYEVLYKHNVQDRIIVFDDVSSLLKNKPMISILKAAMDVGKRTVSFLDNKITTSSQKIKPQMNFVARIIIIDNISKKKIDKALISRGNPVEIQVSKSEMLDYIKQNLAEAPPTALPIDMKLEVWDFLKSEVGEDLIFQIDFRMFLECCRWRALDEDGSWKMFVFDVITDL